MATNRISLYVNVTNHAYSPMGFITDPRYSKIFINMNKHDREAVLIGFVRYLTITMKKMLQESIRKQYYTRYWEPLSQSYLKFKKDHGLSENIWEATGKLVNSISYRRQGDRFVIGIPKHVKYPNGVSVQYVAKCMEFGTKNMPARPLFNPVIRYIRRHVRTYWELYLLHPRKYLNSRLSQVVQDRWR